MFFSLTITLMFCLLITLPFLNCIITINWFNSVFINLPITFSFLSTFNYIFSSVLILIFFILVIYSKCYLKQNSLNYPYFEFTYNTFFCSMLLLICSNNLITTLIAWEFLSITSFLLITYYTLRIKINKSALKALLLNKFEDFNLLVTRLQYLVKYFFVTFWLKYVSNIC